MSAERLRLLSEPYSPSGNMAANGVKKLLGAPRLDLLQTLVREAVQNCCDAAKLGSGPKVRFRLRRLSDCQLETLRSKVLANLPDHPDTSDPVREFLWADAPWVLEICDFNTTGLTGPTRADVPPPPGERTDFVNFIRDIGIRRDTDQGGGTYGFGKSALYVASQCGLIIVDTESRYRGQPVRRFIAGQLGESYVAGLDGMSRRFTGRHWWGASGEEEEYVDPVEGEAAARLAGDLGFPHRAPGDTGTSIMILAPQFVDDNVVNVIGAIKEAVLWNFWPRLMAGVPDARRLDVSIELNGEDCELPAPETVSPLDLFCDAMQGIRDGVAGVQPIQSQRPAATLGWLNIARGMRGERIPLRSDGETLFPASCRHVAVMRPVELVVRYYDDGDPLPQPGVEWAGVFVTSTEPEIEKAFADAEPPAHDDWQPDMLPPRSRARTFVRVAIRRIREAAQAVAGNRLADNAGARDGPSLGRVADLFGRALGSANGQGAGPRNPGGNGGGGRGRAFRISRPAFERLSELDGGVAAIFSAAVKNTAGHSLLLQLEPAIIVDGGGTSSEVNESHRPRVLGVLTDQSSLTGQDGIYDIGTYEGNVVMAVSMPEDGAVTLKARLIEEGTA